VSSFQKRAKKSMMGATTPGFVKSRASFRPHGRKLYRALGKRKRGEGGRCKIVYRRDETTKEEGSDATPVKK